MTPEESKRRYGEEYPAAIVSHQGTRMPLKRERRFSRHYFSEDRNCWHVVSRFMDGSASIQAGELRLLWPGWDEETRIDFCQSCSWLGKQEDFPEMLRLIMRQGEPRYWAGIADSIAVRLPQPEAFDFLAQALRRLARDQFSNEQDLNYATNLTQGVALTKHPEAQTVLREHLQRLWAHPALWDDDEFMNFIAYAAICCILHLLELGAPATDFEPQVQRLSQHVCASFRQICANRLGQHYSWLKTEDIPPTSG